MTIKYRMENEPFARTGSDVIEEFVTYQRSFYEPSTVGIEEQIKRLIDMMGRIADGLDMNLLDLIAADELRHAYHPVISPG